MPGYQPPKRDTKQDEPNEALLNAIDVFEPGWIAVGERGRGVSRSNAQMFINPYKPEYCKSSDSLTQKEMHERVRDLLKLQPLDQHAVDDAAALRRYMRIRFKNERANATAAAKRAGQPAPVMRMPDELREVGGIKKGTKRAPTAKLLAASRANAAKGRAAYQAMDPSARILRAPRRTRQRRVARCVTTDESDSEDAYPSDNDD